MLELGQIVGRITGWFGAAGHDELGIRGYVQDLAGNDIRDMMTVDTINLESMSPVEIVNSLQKINIDLGNLTEYQLLEVGHLISENGGLNGLDLHKIVGEFRQTT